jgi:sulfotransferase
VTIAPVNNLARIRHIVAPLAHRAGSLYTALEAAMSRRNETAVFIDDTQRRDLLQGVFNNYYRAIQSERLVFDTNRIWCAKLPALIQLFPKARVLCCVRDLAWIMDSIERLVRRNAFELSGMFGFESAGTVFGRINRLASSDGMVGFALDALKEAFFGEQASRLVLIEYEALARAPRETLRSLYGALNEPWFEHDFDNVVFAADEFDFALGAPGLHAIRRKVEWIERRTVLPPEIVSRFQNDMFWRFPGADNRQVEIISPGQLQALDATKARIRPN